jgi:hypothetical protein
MTIIAAKALSGYMNRNNVFQRQQSWAAVVYGLDRLDYTKQAKTAECVILSN